MALSTSFIRKQNDRSVLFAASEKAQLFQAVNSFMSSAEKVNISIYNINIDCVPDPQGFYFATIYFGK